MKPSSNTLVSYFAMMKTACVLYCILKPLFTFVCLVLDSTFTWLVVAAVALSCFLTVVSIFLCVLFKPKRKKKMDYILARQNSTF